MHHRLKVDAPSGTAKLLGETAAECREGFDLAANNGKRAPRGRPAPGARAISAFATLRGRHRWAGEHSVIFAGPRSQRLTLSHSAENDPQ